MISDSLLNWLNSGGWLLVAAVFAVLAFWAGAGLAGGRRAIRLHREDRGFLTDMFERMERSGRSEASAHRQELGQQIAGFGDGVRRELGDSRAALDTRLDHFGKSQTEAADTLRSELRQTVGQFGDSLKTDLTERMGLFQKGLGDRQTAFEKGLGERFDALARDVDRLIKAHAEAQEKLREQVEQRLDGLRQSNEAKLEQMRLTVDEKLQGTLEKRLGESFKLVSERLEHVQRGLGEMQTLAVGVGDLKRVLGNVKDRGGWAEIRLGALLEQVLAPEQFEKNVKINPASSEVVEFAIRLPGQDDQGDVFLPVDAKFPKEDYERLEAAWEAGDKEAAMAAADAVGRSIETEAKRISTKYICPPHSTDFAVMFLPTEGLFAEAMRIPGLAERVQTKHRVTLTGPTTLTALLNSLQMGFRTLAIQKRSGEVWQVLGHAKAEFHKYGAVWEKLQKQLATAQNTVEEAGRRTRAVEKRLRTVEALGPMADDDTPRLEPETFVAEDDQEGPPPLPLALNV